MLNNYGMRKWEKERGELILNDGKEGSKKQERIG